MVCPGKATQNSFALVRLSPTFTPQTSGKPWDTLRGRVHERTDTLMYFVPGSIYIHRLCGVRLSRDLRLPTEWAAKIEAVLSVVAQSHGTLLLVDYQWSSTAPPVMLQR
jgi:hypothetical protein